MEDIKFPFEISLHPQVLIGLDFWFVAPLNKDNPIENHPSDTITLNSYFQARKSEIVTFYE